MSNTLTRILIVDDEPTIRDIAKRALKKMNYICDEAQDGEDAISQVINNQYNLVLTDLKMPKVNGLELLRWLHKEHSNLPVIIMTGFADLNSAREAIKLHAADYLVKPFESLAELRSAVERALLENSARADSEVMITELQNKAEKALSAEKELREKLKKAEDEIEMMRSRIEKSNAISENNPEEIELLIRGIKNGILVTDERGGIISMNQEFKVILGVPNIPGDGLSISRLPGVSPLKRAIADSHLRARMNVYTPISVLVENDEATSSVSYEVRSRLLTEGNSKVGILITIQKATDDLNLRFYDIGIGGTFNE